MNTAAAAALTLGGLLLLSVSGCTKSRASEPTVTPVTAHSENTMSHDGYTQGIAVSPPSDLLAWFKGDGKGAWVRIPVVINPSPLGLSSGYIASSTTVPAESGLEIKLDDGAMGVSLAERVRNDCPAGTPCAIWVEGVWGPHLAAPGPGPGGPGPGLGGPGPGGPGPSFGPSKPAFSVRSYVGKVDGNGSNVWVKGA